MAAPKGNKNALGNSGGRPALYATPEDLRAKAEEYIAFCEEKDEYPNIAGLCWFLGFEDKHSFMDQAQRGVEFAATVKTIRNRLYAIKFSKAAAGKMNPTIFIFDAVNNHDMFNTRSENKNEHSGDIGVSITRKVIEGE